MAGKIFINYRREESGHVAGRLHDRLAQAFGRDNLFMDVDNIPVGVDFVTHLNDQVAACDAVLVVIGPKWAKAKDKAGQRRLHQPDDFVAIEIAAALTRDIRVIPVLVDGARMPRASELPDALKPLARRQAAEVRHVNFGQDAETLVARMRKSLGDKTLVKGGPETVGDEAAVVLELERFAAQEREAKAEAETEAKRKADEAEQQQRLAAAKAEQESLLKAAAEAQRQKQVEAEARQQAELEARRLEAEAKRRAEAEQHRKQTETEARRHAEEERTRQKAEAKRQRAVEEERRKRAEAEARPGAEDERGRQETEAPDGGSAESGQWRVRAAIGVAAVAALLLVGWGGYAFVQHTYTTIEQTVQQREALKAEQERQARAAAEAEEKRKAEETERQRLAKAEQERQARAAAVRAEEDRRAKAAAEAEANRKTEAERQRQEGEAASRARDFDKSIANFNEVIRLNQNDFGGYFGRGLAYLDKGDNDRAIADFKEAIRTRSEVPSFLCKPGHCLS